MSAQRRNQTSDARAYEPFTAPSCPPLAKRRAIALPFQEDGDAHLISYIMRDTPITIPKSLAPPACVHGPVPESIPACPRTFQPPPAAYVASSFIPPAHSFAQPALSQQIHADLPSIAQRRQSPSPSRVTRREREGRRDSIRVSTLPHGENTADIAATLDGSNTRRRTSDISLSTSSSSSNHSTQSRF